jgi:hypothetical protein
MSRYIRISEEYYGSEGVPFFIFLSLKYIIFNSENLHSDKISLSYYISATHLDYVK